MPVISPELAAELDLLDDEALTPHEYGSRGILKPEAAEVADLWLRRLARRETLSRVVLGRVADVFLTRGAHHALGFARVSDYTRERLGLSASQFYELARVARELPRLPRVFAALQCGEIGWTKARELAGTASPENEAQWLAVARAYTADGLKLAARRFKQGPVPLADAASLDELAREAVRAAVDRYSDLRSTGAGEVGSVLEDNEIDGEPAATFRIRCPRRVLRLWARTRELARKVAGSQLSDWQAVEAIAAENLAAIGATSARVAAGCDKYAAGLAGNSERRGLPRSLKERNFIEASGPEPPIDPDNDFDIMDGIRWDNDRTLVADRVPDELERLADGAIEASPHELDRRMQFLLAAMARVDWQLGRLLRMTFGLRLHWELGYLSEGSYVRNRLGMCSRKARALVALDRRSWQSSLALTDAYRRGRLSWYRCLMLVPIVNEANTEAWLERACQVPARRLEEEVEWALEIAGNSPFGLKVMPPPMGDALDRHLCAHCGREHSEAELNGEASVAGDDRSSTSRHAGVGAATDETRAGTTTRQIRGHQAEVCVAVRYAGEAAMDAQIRFNGPASVISMLDSVIRQHCSPSEPLWRGFERALLHAEAQWSALPKHRDPVFPRDGWRCTAPSCSSRRNLQDHHVVFRSRGGSNVRLNRISVCAWHHHRGIHAGRVRVYGVAGALNWELGLRRDGPPLMRTRGDRYLEEVEEAAVVGVQG